MNRRERRRMEKQLGLTKHHQKKTIKQKLSTLQDNIASGKQKSEKTQYARAKQEQNISEEEANQRISSIATTLTISEGLSWYDAMEKAKKEYEKETGSNL
jgi:hypothetical protein